MPRKSAKEARAGIEHFTAERLELAIVIIAMAFMISIIDSTFRLFMYIIIGVALLLMGYNYYLSLKNPPEESEEEKEVLISMKP